MLNFFSVPVPGVDQMAPTANLIFQKQKHEVELAKQKIAAQEDMIVELTRGRDFLREQLSLSSKTSSLTNHEKSPDPSAKSASDSSSSPETSSSSSTNYSSSSSTSTSSDDGKKKRKGMKKKSKKIMKKTKRKKRMRGTESKRNTRSCVSRAHGPAEVIERYAKVLRTYKKKKSITAACRKVGVDRNTISLNAPIAELAIAAPEKYAELSKQHTRKDKLGDFAGKCLDVIVTSTDIEDKVQALKRSGKLLPLGKGNF
ncbi:coiled-coil domain-containing protein 106-like [Xyrauchen texanus]|uniref:coiled-coil domain-containing protein 106-like n=1 Tax=Xyrauchen texanus TaxID=154827 RepID=UPI002241E7EC|nr:coiled-coil domain-containing protein 106-like [Xyrauchen texanus]